MHHPSSPFLRTALSFAPHFPLHLPGRIYLAGADHIMRNGLVDDAGKSLALRDQPEYLKFTQWLGR
jgi:hypothetical protein